MKFMNEKIFNKVLYVEWSLFHEMGKLKWEIK